MFWIVLLCVFATGFIGGALYGYWVGRSTVHIPVHVPVRSYCYTKTHGRK